ncbi:MAG: methyltransferase domain-containing protein [Gemmataceae bacterium]
MSLLLTQRQLRSEIMDQPGLAPHLHAQALRGLQRVNWWSGSSGLYWPWIRRAAKTVAPRPLRVLDLATGGGDVPIRLWCNAQAAGLNLEIEGCDRSETAIAHARRSAISRSASVQFFIRDVLEERLPQGYDLLLCSLFLHHLEEHQAVDLLKRMAESAGLMILVNDLVRGPLGFALAYVGTRVLSSSPVVHADGPQSVAGAFTVAEMRRMAQQAGLGGAIVKRRWPFRMLLRWNKT